MRDENDTDAGDPPRGNRCTIAEWKPAVEVPFALAFERVFPVLRAVHAAFRGPGLLAAAVYDGRELDSHLFLDLDGRDGAEGAHGLLGRHERCDLHLGRDPSLSLRHALLRATHADGDVRVRLLDLASGVGLRTEDGVPCESLAAEGALFVRAGRYQLLLLPTGDLAQSWGETARETWESFPDRVYFDLRVPERLPRPVERARVRAAKAESSLRGSRITHIVAPARQLRAPEMVGSGLVIGRLSLTAREEEISHAITDEDLERGVLVGRYERCALGAPTRALSRVHLLLMRDLDGLWAIDTASTNGTREAGTPVRAVRLDRARGLDLGGAVHVAWHPEARPQA